MLRSNANIIKLKSWILAQRRLNQPRLTPDQIRRRNQSNVAALVFAGLLVGVGWMLVQKLSYLSNLQDCVMSGRTNCAPIDTASH